MSNTTCRFCRAPLQHVVIDLGMSPPANNLVTADHLSDASTFYPLRVFVCHNCWLVQLPEYQTPADTFSDYAYFSSYSTSWIDHARRYAKSMRERLRLDEASLVVEVASNDGYLLRGFLEQGIGVLGIEPARNVAAKAQADGIPTLSEFFGMRLARELKESGKHADLLTANNVLAHVPDINDFVEGIRELLKPQGVATLEFPHLAKLIEKTEFDTIYHEHLSYFSLLCVDKIFAAHKLTIFDVDELSTHGGSLRVYVSREEAKFPKGAEVDRILSAERAAGYESERPYRDFERRVRACKRQLLQFLVSAAGDGHRVAGYGAPAKATTLLNYCGAGPDLIEFTVDKNPYKQGRFIPGVRVPIGSPQQIFDARPAYVLIFPWNIKDEIVSELSGIRAWGAKFVVPIPELTVLA
jgi:SAM-dependent methyltransferase